MYYAPLHFKTIFVQLFLCSIHFQWGIEDSPGLRPPPPPRFYKPRGRSHNSSSYLFISPRAGLHFRGFFYETTLNIFTPFYNTTLKLATYDNIMREKARKNIGSQIDLLGVAAVECRLVTSGSRADPSRGAAAHLCNFHNHVRPGSHGLWLLLSPDADRGLLEGTKTGVSADYWLS